MTPRLADRYRVTSWQSTTRSSCALAIDTQDADRRVFVKRLPTRERFACERAELLRAARVTAAVSGIGVPPLHAADEDDLTLVLGYVDEPQSLLNYAWNEPRRLRLQRGRRATPDAIGARLGAWLAAYRTSSEQSGEEVVSGPRESLIRAARSRLDTLQRHDPSFLQPATFTRAFADIDALGVRLRSNRTLTAATAHGDLNLSNVLIAADGMVYIIDFADARQALAAEDVVNVWHTLEMIATLSSRHGALLEGCLDALSAGAGLTTNQFAERDDVQLLRINQALVQILAARGIGWLDRRLGRRTHWKLAELNRRWLEAGRLRPSSITGTSRRG